MTKAIKWVAINQHKKYFTTQLTNNDTFVSSSLLEAKLYNTKSDLLDSLHYSLNNNPKLFEDFVWKPLRVKEEITINDQKRINKHHRS